MDTSNYVSTAIVGGVVNFPDTVFGSNPTIVQAEQINSPGNQTTVIPLRGSVVTSLTGVFVNGVNQNYPGAV